MLESVEQEDEDGEEDSVVCNGTSINDVHADHNTNGEPDSGYLRFATYTRQSSFYCHIGNVCRLKITTRDRLQC